MRGFSSEGVVLPLWAWFHFCGRGFTFVGVVFTSVGVILPLWVRFYLCGRSLISVGVVFPLWAWF